MARIGWLATIYQFACGLVAYFAPEARDFQEAGELGRRSYQGTAHTEATALNRPLNSSKRL